MNGPFPVGYLPDNVHVFNRQNHPVEITENDDDIGSLFSKSFENNWVIYLAIAIVFGIATIISGGIVFYFKRPKFPRRRQSNTRSNRPKKYRLAEALLQYTSRL